MDFLRLTNDSRRCYKRRRGLILRWICITKLLLLRDQYVETWSKNGLWVSSGLKIAVKVSRNSCRTQIFNAQHCRCAPSPSKGISLPFNIFLVVSVFLTVNNTAFPTQCFHLLFPLFSKVVGSNFAFLVFLMPSKCNISLDLALSSRG